MENFRLVHTFYHYLAEIGSLYKTYGSRERVGPPLQRIKARPKREARDDEA